MKTLNYRHSLQTMQKQAEKHGYRVGFIMSCGQPIWTVSENNVICGYYYTATDIADFINRVSK